jgi:hypothetical protein
LDNSSEIFSTAAAGSTVSFAQNPFNTDRGERGNSGFDFPNLFGLAFIYDLPFEKDQRGLLGHVLGGWQLNTTYRYSSGQPLTVIQASGDSGYCDQTSTMSSFYDACRPILSNARLPMQSVGQYCDGSPFTCVVDPTTGSAQPLGTLIAFGDPCFGTYDPVNQTGCTPATISGAHWIQNSNAAALFLGSPFKGTPRNTLRGQPISTVNLAVFKNIKISEKLTFQFQAQAFDVLNTQYRGAPDPVLEDVGQNTPGVGPAFLSTAYNFNGGGNNLEGGGNSSANLTYDGIGRRRLLFGGKLIF